MASAEERPKSEPFRYCLNTSTIRGQKLSLVEEIEIAAKAGYDGIEPWIREIEVGVTQLTKNPFAVIIIAHKDPLVKRRR